MPFYTNENLKANSPRSNGDTLVMKGTPPTAEEFAIQKALESRAAIERAAQLERPIYGMWGLKEGENEQHLISSDPNKIAEINAIAEMSRTGLDRYYKPQSGAYFEAFNKIRDKYLQQELGKKAAVEAEGRAIVANRVGAFDKILQERAEVEKNKGLAELRKAQAKEAEARAKSYEGDGMTPKERLASKKDEKAKLAAMADDSRVQLLAKINDPATSTQDRATYIDAMNKINTNLDADFALIDKGEAPQHMKEFFKWQAFPSQYKPMSNTQAPTGLAGVPINASNIQTPKAQGVTYTNTITPDIAKSAKEGKVRVGFDTKNNQYVITQTNGSSKEKQPPTISTEQPTQEDITITPELLKKQKQWERYNRESLGLRGLFLNSPIDAQRQQERSRKYWEKENERARLAEIERIKRQKERRDEVGLN